MPIAFMALGFVLIIAGARGQAGNLGRQVGTDFDRGFLAWVAAIMLIGFVGYVPSFQRASRGMLVLIILVYALGNSGAWSQLTQAVEKPPSSDPEAVPQVSASSGNGGSSGILGDVKSGLGIVGSIASFF